MKVKNEFNEEFVIDNREFEMVKQFLSFIRQRERGIITISIITHNKRRYAMLDATDRFKIDLNPIKVENGDNNC